ncbi:hypothetical protein [Litchfieldia alkalitelluris]|uniref:hypothetical protein n=1 Tax=Litchfieldia alkalitelluris TaxID=304268 RepID=UPI0009987E37|nr:hypothetical protein [Litchfieldia alkalitelluris]
MNLISIQNICSQIENDDFFLYSKLPKIKQESLHNNFPNLQENKVIAFVDTTLYKTCSFGLVLSEDGLHWKNYWLNPTKNHFLNWDQFKHSTIALKQNQVISLSENMDFDAFGVRNFVDTLVNLLKSLQQTGVPGQIQDVSYKNTRISPLVETIVTKHLTILELKDFQEYYDEVIRVIKAPYNFQKSQFQNSNDYYTKCTKELLIEIETMIKSSSHQKETLLNVIANSIEELSQNDSLWENIHHKMKMIKVQL